MTGITYTNDLSWILLRLIVENNWTDSLQPNRSRNKITHYKNVTSYFCFWVYTGKATVCFLCICCFFYVCYCVCICQIYSALLTLCMLGNFACIFVVCFFFFFFFFVFFNYFFFQNKSFRNTIRVSDSLDPDQARHFVGPDLGLSCLQRISAYDNSRH